MTEEMNPEEVPLSAAQSAAAAAYHAPPDIVPRDAMWDAIRTRREKAVGIPDAAIPASSDAVPVTVLHTRRSVLQRVPRWFAAAGAAALVVIAIGVTRRVPTRTAATPIATDSAGSAATAVAWQVASSEHFGVAESMLTMLSNSPAQQGDAQLTAWSRDLLESTRLLIDSPAGRDPKRRALLLDLELVLVQLVQSGPTMHTEDRTVMDDLLTRAALLLTRIRTAIPAGMPASHNP